MWITQGFLTWVGRKHSDSILDVGRGAYDPYLANTKSMYSYRRSNELLPKQQVIKVKDLL